MAFDLFGTAQKFVNTGSVGATGTAVRQYSADKLYGFIGDKSTLFKRINRAKESYGYLVDTVTGEKLFFQYNVIPRESGGANLKELAVLGRSVPVYHYTGGKARTLALNITFTMTKSDRSDIERAIKFCRSLAYPDYGPDLSLENGPHPVVLVQGKLYSQDTWLVQSFDLTYGEALDPDTALPESVTINLSLVETSLAPKSYSEVIRL